MIEGFEKIYCYDYLKVNIFPEYGNSDVYFMNESTYSDIISPYWKANFYLANCSDVEAKICYLNGKTKRLFPNKKYDDISIYNCIYRPYILAQFRISSRISSGKNNCSIRLFDLDKFKSKITWPVNDMILSRTIDYNRDMMMYSEYNKIEIWSENENLFSDICYEEPIQNAKFLIEKNQLFYIVDDDGDKTIKYMDLRNFSVIFEEKIPRFNYDNIYKYYELSVDERSIICMDIDKKCLSFFKKYINGKTSKISSLISNTNYEIALYTDYCGYEEYIKLNQSILIEKLAFIESFGLTKRLIYIFVNFRK